MSLTEEEREEAIALKEELTRAGKAILEVLPKVNQLIEGEITREEYNEWCDEHIADFDDLETI
jgi:hypothetical protein